MSKAVKTVVSVVAAIAIPFAAPVIAKAIGLSTAIGSAIGSATAGSVIGGAITGAALGAVKGAVLGEDVGRNALFGGIGGGIGGYASAASAGGAVGGTGLMAPSGATAASGSPYALGTGTSGTGLTLGGGGTGLSMGTTAGGLPTSAVGAGGGLSAAVIPVDYSLTAGLQFPSVGLNPATASYGLQAPDPGFFASSVDRALATSQAIDYSLAAGMPPSQGLSVVGAAPGGGTQVITGQGVYTSTTPISAYSGGSYSPTLAAGGTTALGDPTSFINQLPAAESASSAATQTAQTAGTTAAQTAGTTTAQTAAQPKSFSEALKSVPGAVADKFKDPKVLADLILRAGGQLAGSVLAGEGLTAEEQMLLQAMSEELRQLQQANQALFNQRLEQAQALIGESKYFDPEYFGLQRARRAQLAGAKAKKAGLRGLTGERREAEARRYDLATARDTGTAYDVGYGLGVQGRLGTMQAGIAAMPGYMTPSTQAYGALAALYGKGEERRAQQATDIGRFFGDLTGTQQSQSLG